MSVFDTVWAKLQHYRWKRRINGLIVRGMKIGNNVEVSSQAYFDEGHPYLISIGNNCAICAGVRILSHDATVYKYTEEYTRLGKVDIKDNVFIGENCIILPDVTIGPNVLIAAGSVVNKSIPPNSCVAGTPARFYAKWDEMITSMLEQIRTRPVFSHDELFHNENHEMREKAQQAVKDGIAFIKGYTGPHPYCVNPAPLEPLFKLDSFLEKVDKAI